MGSISKKSIKEILAEKYSDLDEHNALIQYAYDNSYEAIVQYKSEKDGEYSNYGMCSLPSQIQGYFSSPYCFDAELVFQRKRESKALFNVVSKLSKVTVICFIPGSITSPTYLPNEYCKSIIKKNYAPNLKVVGESLVIGTKSEWKESDALCLAEKTYSQSVKWNQIKDYGKPIDSFIGYDDDNNRIIALIFEPIF